ncbi:MAG: hypothetical protein ACLPYS_10390 [Vulcanimicrobiaceae bacterium]
MRGANDGNLRRGAWSGRDQGQPAKQLAWCIDYARRHGVEWRKRHEAQDGPGCPVPIYLQCREQTSEDSLERLKAVLGMMGSEHLKSFEKLRQRLANITLPSWYAEQERAERELASRSPPLTQAEIDDPERIARVAESMELWARLNEPPSPEPPLN